MKPNSTENCPLDIEDCVCARCPYREEMEISVAPPWLTHLLVTALTIGGFLGAVWVSFLLIRAIAFFDFS